MKTAPPKPDSRAVSASAPADPGRLPPPREAEVAAQLGPYGTWPYTERRSGRDRRAGPTQMISRFLFRGQRAFGRRKGEGANIYVDRYAKPDLVLASTILVLNILDAWLTLVYLGYGGTEANPIARWLLFQGMGVFVGTKCLLVGACLLFLALHKTFHYVRGSMRLLLSFYGALLVYHIYLQAVAIRSQLA